MGNGCLVDTSGNLFPHLKRRGRPMIYRFKEVIATDLDTWNSTIEDERPVWEGFRVMT